MRWLALAIVLCTASGVAAEVVRRRDPPVVEACRGSKDWSQIERCLDKLGSFKIERSAPRARLVHVFIDDKAWTGATSPEDAGYYLYVQQRNATWRVGGMYRRGANDTIVGLVPVTITGHDGWRLDAGSLIHTPLSLDGAPPVPVSIRTVSSLYCDGGDYRCNELQTTCEVMARGKARLVFHGTLRVAKGDVFVDGDQSRAGSVCRGAQSISLGWSESDED